MAAAGSDAGPSGWVGGVPLRGYQPLQQIPLLRDQKTQAEKTLVLRYKLRACALVYPKSKEQWKSERDRKRAALHEIYEFLTGNDVTLPFEDEVLPDLTAMLLNNIARSLPARMCHPLAMNDDEEEPVLDENWGMLQVVYDILQRLVAAQAVDGKLLRKLVDKTFVLKLLELFDSEDPRERDLLKTLLHRLYGKCMQLRVFIRKAIQHLFNVVAYVKDIFCGTSELLEIMGSIINGYALPLKDEHKEFLSQALLPLHRCRTLMRHQQPLLYCVTQYVEKDPKLAVDVIETLLHSWPVASAPKQVLYLNEVEEVLELATTNEFQKLAEPLSKRVAQCIQAPHFQVAERALFLWNSDPVVRLINEHRAVVYPLIYSALLHDQKSHWNASIQSLSTNVLKLMQDHDSALCEQCAQENRMRKERTTKRAQEVAAYWSTLEASYAEILKKMTGPKRAANGR